MTERPLASRPLLPRMISASARGVLPRPIRPDIHARFVLVVRRVDARDRETTTRPVRRLKWGWRGVEVAK